MQFVLDDQIGGSQAATEHYARACLDAGVSLVNCIPVFIASDP